MAVYFMVESLTARVRVPYLLQALLILIALIAAARSATEKVIFCRTAVFHYPLPVRF